MRSFVRKFAVVAGVVVAGVVVAPVTQAQATVATCPGSEVSGFPKSLKNQLGDLAGSLHLWYSSASGGTNCAKVYDDASGSHSMSVSIRRSDQSTPVTDSGRGAAQPAEAARRSSRSAVASASSTPSRSPSRTWSRLYAL
ncbi:hypothetical protein [Amycolatopsis camponoti]|uniref:hypothetical protein n=1 Tax=Amycolatopsis camponoti TaxID=2606593 RepID=UPI0012D7BFA8|nr:hypothetical protein [Amycolatopsis camponoti]